MFTFTPNQPSSTPGSNTTTARRGLVGLATAALLLLPLLAACDDGSEAPTPQTSQQSAENENEPGENEPNETDNERGENENEPGENDNERDEHEPGENEKGDHKRPEKANGQRESQQNENERDENENERDEHESDENEEDD